MNRVPLFEEYRLIEKSEHDINGAWKGAHLLLFFLAFVFGSFCTFCFHMLMYLFDEKCVLFPKLLSLTSLRHNVIYEFIPTAKDLTDMPVDFVSTQWVEKSTCSLPTYVPLVSGIFGLVWTTMFLMCSTGSRTLTGLQRPWRVLPPVFIFSLAMGVLCVYSSAVTHYGLQELCLKLGEITGSPTCTYTVNVATLTYERRIRGVYQATRLTILSAWLHTACWLLSALLALVRVLLAVDFQLVRVNVQLHGDIDKILEKHEVQIRTVSPDVWANNEYDSDSESAKQLSKEPSNEDEKEEDEVIELDLSDNDLIHETSREGFAEESEPSLVLEEQNRLARRRALAAVPRDKQFIVKLVYDLVDSIYAPRLSKEEESGQSIASISSSTEQESKSATITRQIGKERILSNDAEMEPQSEDIDFDDPVIRKLVRVDSLLVHTYNVKKVKEAFDLRGEPVASTSRAYAVHEQESVLNLTPDLKRVLDQIASSKEQNMPPQDQQQPEKTKRKSILKEQIIRPDNQEATYSKKPERRFILKDQSPPPEDQEQVEPTKSRRRSNLKTIGVQTDHDKKIKGLHVLISEHNMQEQESSTDANNQTSTDKKDEVDKETQTPQKEKQD